MAAEFKRVIQCGAGGVGFWVAIGLARELPVNMEYICFDNDDFNGGLGHSRLPHVSNPDTKKVNMLKQFISISMGDRLITVVNGLFTGEEVREGDLVVDCSDMKVADRRPVWELCKANGGRCLRISYDGKNDIVAVAEGLPLGNPPGGYSAAPGLPLSLMAGGIGSLAVMRLINGFEGHMEFQVSLAEKFGADIALPETSKGLEGLSEFLNPNVLENLSIPSLETLGEEMWPITPSTEPENASQGLETPEMAILTSEQEAKSDA